VSAAGQVAGGASLTRPTVFFSHLKNLLVFYPLSLSYPKKVMSINKNQLTAGENTIQKKKLIASVLAATATVSYKHIRPHQTGQALGDGVLWV
ncbi:hypothetical protein ACVGW7_03630, partial [Enterobacter intestinihominis]